MIQLEPGPNIPFLEKGRLYREKPGHYGIGARAFNTNPNTTKYEYDEGFLVLENLTSNMCSRSLFDAKAWHVNPEMYPKIYLLRLQIIAEVWFLYPECIEILK